MSLDRELQSYAVSEGEGKYETAVSHGYIGYIGYGINVALAHEGLTTAPYFKMKYVSIVNLYPAS